MDAINPNAELLESRACKVLFTVIRESTTTQRDVSRRPASSSLGPSLCHAAAHPGSTPEMRTPCSLSITLRDAPVALHSMLQRQTG